MKKINQPAYSEKYYEETLPNGLSVILYEKPDFIGSCAIFATPYGSLDAKQKINQKPFIVPNGAAHFLEHKLFEEEGGDIIAQFSALGANVNAFTSYQETMYYFTSGEADICEPLTLLLDFVQRLHITDASVEKEKNIIVQELLMYQQMPDIRLFNETFNALFHQYPLKYDIGGTPESVRKITAQQLRDAYKYNYHPANMTLLVITAQDPQVLMELIRKNQAEKQFDTFAKPQRWAYREPAVCKEYTRKAVMEVQSAKTAVAFKLPVIQKNPLERQRLEWALRFLLEAYFGPLSSVYQSWMDKGYITDYFGYESDFASDYSMVMFYNETEDAKQFERRILHRLKAINPQRISQRLLNQLAKRYYGQAVAVLDSPEDTAVSFLRSRFQNVSLFDAMNLPQQVTKEDMETVMRLFDYKEHAVIQITGK